MDKLKAYSKVNLILKVFPKAKREAKHKIKSLFCLCPKLYNEILVEESDSTVVIYTQNGKPCKMNKSKILLAIEYLSGLLKKEIHLHITINKMIALMSGLGGSATDTASIIKWITNKYHFQLSPLHLKYIALHIGSDIPFFLSGYKTAWVSGYGDEVIEYKKPIPKFNIILTNIKMDTTKVYQSMNKNYVSQVNVRHACKHLNRNSFCKDTIYNDMWVFAKKINRRLANLSNRLAKSKNIILSGSGGSLVEIC